MGADGARCTAAMSMPSMQALEAGLQIIDPERDMLGAALVQIGVRLPTLLGHRRTTFDLPDLKSHRSAAHEGGLRWNGRHFEALLERKPEDARVPGECGFDIRH